MAQTQSKAKPATDEEPTPTTVLALGAMNVPMAIQAILPKRVLKKGGKADETVAAYEFTFVALLPEDMAALLLPLIRDHKVMAHLRDETFTT